MILLHFSTNVVDLQRAHQSAQSKDHHIVTGVWLVVESTLCVHQENCNLETDLLMILIIIESNQNKNV